MVPSMLVPTMPSPGMTRPLQRGDSNFLSPEKSTGVTYLYDIPLNFQYKILTLLGAAFFCHQEAQAGDVAPGVFK